MNRRHGRIARGVLAGMAGGLVASWTMDEFQALWSKAAQRLQENGRQRQQQGQGESQPEAEAEDATMKAADKLSRNLLGYPLSIEAKKKAGPILHYAFGAAMGAVYGVASELFPEAATRGFGTGFGAALFAIADELAIPALGLSGKRKNFPLSSHVYGLASHLVYGVTAEGVRRIATAAL
jgi:putative membrane protein